MISVLIPIYNYSILPLVKELIKQFTLISGDFEIICIDDASSIIIKENQDLNKLQNVTYIELKKNIGRSKIRNLLARKAQFEWLLFLDCDVYPKNKYFVKKYFEVFLKHDFQVCSGGLCYKNKTVENSKKLRWLYGRKRESLLAEERRRNPYKTILGSNFLIKKKLFNNYSFDEGITDYGYEDLLFFIQLQKKNIDVMHINNSVYHNGIETNKIFLEKTNIALKNLYVLNKKNRLNSDDVKILRYNNFIKKYRITFLVRFLKLLFENKVYMNLLSKNPKIYLFDIYKLFYLIDIDRNEVKFKE